jgi:hypothetical protein
MQHLELRGRAHPKKDTLHHYPFGESYPHEIWAGIEEFVGIMVAGRVAQPVLIHLVGGEAKFFTIAKRFWRDNDWSGASVLVER